MECSCNIYTDNADAGPEFESRRICTARKPHRCAECRREIMPGERYERYTGKWEWGIDTFKTCPDCLTVRDTMFPEGFIFGVVWDYVWEHVFEARTLPENCLAMLTPNAREKCCGILERLWDETEDDE